MSQPDPQWGKCRNDGPPDLDELIRKYMGKLKLFLGGKPGEQAAGPSGPSGQMAAGVGGLVLAVLALLWIASGFYVVDLREQGVVLRFGRYVESTDPGLRWRMPWPIEKHEIVRISAVRSVEVGFHGDVKNRVADESLMLTQDQNIIDVQLEVQYDVKDAKAFVFSNARADSDVDAKDIVKQAAETAIREVVGRNKVDFVLNEGRGQVSADATRLIQALLDDYNSGIRISRVNINNIQPPEPVQAAFADANKAGQDKVKLKNEGNAYANDVIPKASGLASRLLEEAEGYKQGVIARAQGDAARFRQVATEYAKAPQVTRDRMYIDTMQQIMSNTTKVLVDQKSGSGNLLYLPLDKLMQMAGNQPVAPAAGDSPRAGELPAVAAESRPKLDLTIRNERESR